MSFMLRWIINAVAIWVATLILPGLEVVGGDDAGTTILVYLVVALVFGVVNAIVKPVVKLLSFPLYILTLGVFTLIVNAGMLWLTAWLTEQTDYGLRIDTFGTAVLGALIIGVVSFALSVAIPGARKVPRGRAIRARQSGRREIGGW